MKTKMNLILFIFLISFNFIIVYETSNDRAPIKDNDYPDIACGKKNPQKETDCTEFGTDSGMLCCWVSNKDKKEQFCTLLSYKIAKEKNILGEMLFVNEEKNSFWSCGNKSFNLNLNILFIFASLLLFF